MKQSLEKRITVFAFAILAMTILASTTMEIVAIRRDYTKEIQLRSRTIATSLKTSIEKVLALGIKINDVNGIAEKCGESIQSDQDMAYCIITDVNGNILFSSNKQTPHVTISANLLKSQYAIPNKEPHSAAAVKLGSFFNTSLPIHSFDTSIAAYINIGFHQSRIDDKVQDLVIRAIVVLLVFFSIAFITVVIYVKKCIVAPISTLLKCVTKISQGDYSAHIQPLQILEFDELSVKINQMSAALKSRDNELRNNYDELTSTHKHLHNSYIQLEALSLELEKSEELFRKILEESGDAILILDKSEHIMIANKRCTELFGISHAEMAGQHISSLLLSIQADNISHILNTINSGLHNEFVSEDMIFSNGQEQRIGKLDISNISQGEKKLLQLVIRDVTREREILNNLEESAAGLSRLNKMKDSFLGLASHELKTPLTVILGYSELLQNDMKDQISDTAAEMVANISNAAIRLDGIIKDMIDVSLFDQNQISLKRTHFDINQLVESTIQELRFFFAIRKQEIAVDLEPSLPLYYGDRSRLAQMLSNVIGNAIKFTPDGGRISVKTALRRILNNTASEGYFEITSTQIGRRYQDAIEITVSDTGIGINRDDHLKIFDKFYEVGNIEEHSSGKVAFKSRGAGLGLSIAKGVAEIHGGQIWVESSGQNLTSMPGSTFFIVLPLDKDEVGDTMTANISDDTLLH